MSIIDKLSIATPSERGSQAELSGLWIVTCRYVISGENLFVDRDFYENPELCVWHFTPNGALFIMDSDDLDLTYSWSIHRGLLHIEPQGGGNFGKAGEYDFYIGNDEAILSRLDPIRPGSRLGKEAEGYMMVRYRDADLDYRALKEIHYREALDSGGVEVGIEWEKQRLYEAENRLLERLCAEKGVMIEEED